MESVDARSEIRNTAGFISLQREASEFFDNWAGIANDAVAIPRAEAGRDPYDERLSQSDDSANRRAGRQQGRRALTSTT